jgi:hypothetical protein
MQSAGGTRCGGEDWGAFIMARIIAGVPSQVVGVCLCFVLVNGPRFRSPPHILLGEKKQKGTVLSTA